MKATIVVRGHSVIEEYPWVINEIDFGPDSEIDIILNRGIGGLLGQEFNGDREYPRLYFYGEGGIFLGQVGKTDPHFLRDTGMGVCVLDGGSFNETVEQAIIRLGGKADYITSALLKPRRQDMVMGDWANGRPRDEYVLYKLPKWSKSFSHFLTHQEERDYGREVVTELSKLTKELCIMLLDREAKIDPSAGIIIVPLDIKPSVSELEQLYYFFAGRVLPASDDVGGYVNPHVHHYGFEPYVFLAGDGEMNIGTIGDGKVFWIRRQYFHGGDMVRIGSGEVHSLRNTGTKPLDFVFACPLSHVGKDEGNNDRVFTLELENGIPSHYNVKK